MNVLVKKRSDGQIEIWEQGETPIVLTREQAKTLANQLNAVVRTKE